MYFAPPVLLKRGELDGTGCKQPWPALSNQLLGCHHKGGLLDTLWGVLLGWLFGILGQRPITYIQNSIKKPSLQKSIVAELKDLRCRLAMASYLLADRTGSIDKKFLLWIKPILKSYSGFYIEINMAEIIEKILLLEDGAFDAFIEIKKSNIDKRKGLAIKKYGMPFINENYKDLCLFDMKFQKDISEVRC